MISLQKIKIQGLEVCRMISSKNKNLSKKEQIFFIKRLAFLIKAGITTKDSLVVMREQANKDYFATILDVAISGVSSGQDLHRSLGKFKKSFSDFVLSIIAFGEQSGVLAENLEYLAEELRKKDILRKKVISAFIYPSIVILATLGIVLFLVVYLFPKIIPIFTSLHMELPISTRIVVFVSAFLGKWWLLCVLLSVVLFVLFFIFIKENENWQKFIGRTAFRTPILAQIIVDYNLANFTRTLSILLRCGVGLTEALPIVIKTTQNLIYKEKFNELSVVISRGGKMSNYFMENKQFFPEVTTQIVSVGEHGGNLSESLMYLSEMHESEVDEFTRNLSSLLEPVLMVFMGVVVGFIAISIITPIYGITQHLQLR